MWHELAALRSGFHPDRLEEVLETRSAMLQAEQAAHQFRLHLKDLNLQSALSQRAYSVAG